MKASYRWICALVPELKAEPRELAERLTRAGIAVDSIEEFGAGTKDLVVAEVRKVEPHPSRPKLRLVTVDRGGSEQRVVCGAPNVPDPGGLVVLAPLGTTLPAVGMTLTAREIGGVTSEGMLCSETEMGLVGAGKSKAAGAAEAAHGEGDAGILILPKGSAKAGTPLREALGGAHDFIFDIDLTPNRPDCLGHVGIAREVAALYDLPFGTPSPDAPPRVAQGSLTNQASISIEDTERCPHYGAALVVDVKVGPSPAWLRYRLESLGIRSISNVVDATNLILLEFGHPIHAFDLDLVRGLQIIVRHARDGEKLTTLDGVERALAPDDLVIADGEGAVALAGVMGGANSEIRAETKRVLIECAYFEPRGVRRTSRRHGIHTEASHRFERGVDPRGVPDVLAQAASLITTLCGGAGMPDSIIAGVAPAEPVGVPLRERRMSALLGVEVPLAEATKILTRLGCSVQPPRDEGEGPWAYVLPPSHRPDIKLEADLIDEVIRVQGLDKVPTVLPAIRPQPLRTGPDAALGPNSARARVRRAAIEVGLSEAVTFGFVSPKELAALGVPASSFVIKNPLTEDRSVMRTSLLPGLLEALRKARRRGEANVRLFTIGAKFMSRGAVPDGGKASLLPDEVPSFAAVIAGFREAKLTKPVEIDVFDAKGIAVEIAERATRRTATVAHQPAERRAPYLHPRAAGDVILDGVVVGSFGLLHPDTIDALDLGGPAVVVELDLRELERLGIKLPQFKPIPSLPAATRDIALIVPDDVSAGSVGEAIREAAGELCESIELFDLFRGGNIPPEYRSLAFHVVYRDPKAATDPDAARTLTDEEVDTRHAAVVESVRQKFGAVLRT
jgi:phenylalanyl-tRNA synthetase beta chain